MCILLLWALPAVSAPEPLRADQAMLPKGGVETGGIVGASVPVTWLRAHKDRRLAMGAVQIGRFMTNPRGFLPLRGSFEFVLEVTPLMVLHQPKQTFGIAASPLHMRWNFAPGGGGPVRVFAEASGGVVYTRDAVPARTTTFNFIDQAGFGLRIGRQRRPAWLLGYRFQHISNAGRVKPNPGVNFNLAYVGVSFLR
jgi:hypothetical protein